MNQKTLSKTKSLPYSIAIQQVKTGAPYKPGIFAKKGEAAPLIAPHSSPTRQALKIPQDVPPQGIQPIKSIKMS